MTKQWIYYTNSINDRFNVYQSKLSDEAVENYRTILAKIKEGLPDEKKGETDLEAIDNPEAETNWLAIIGGFIALILILWWILSPIL